MRIFEKWKRIWSGEYRVKKGDSLHVLEEYYLRDKWPAQLRTLLETLEECETIMEELKADREESVVTPLSTSCKVGEDF